MRRVHGEATKCVMFMGRQRNASCSSGGNRTCGSQPAGLEQNARSCSSRGLGWNRRWKRGLAYRTTEETDLLCSERGPVDRKGCGVPQNGGNEPPTVETGVLFIRRGVTYRKTDEMDLCWSATVKTGVLLIGRGVAYRKTDETDLCWSATVEMGVLFIGRGVAYRKMGLHGILFISTVDLLQPPRATVHPTSTSSTLHLRLFIHGLLFIQPPPRATPPATVQPPLSTGSCSTTPPWATVHPPLHCLLFIQSSTGSSCSSSPPLGPVHPAPTGSIDRGPVHPEATPRVLFIHSSFTLSFSLWDSLTHPICLYI